MTAKFSGFPRGAFEFFEQLAHNNNREWFRAHQEVYERDCREPMKLLVAELSPNAAASKIQRINRDMRFSRDKSPYRTYIAGRRQRSIHPALSDGTLGWWRDLQT